MSVSSREVHKRRAHITALPLYYTGHLSKKHSYETDFKKNFAELRGDTLFLYKDDKQDTYTEKLNLLQLRSMKLASPYQRKIPTIFIIIMHTEEVHLKMDNPDIGEEWRAYIMTMVKKEIPSQLQLLPGQRLLLEDALAQEKIRISQVEKPPLPPRPAHLLGASVPPQKDTRPEMLPCFFNVTRQEAENMLRQNPEFGDIILRPSAMANNYALTLRHVTAKGPVMKNYRLIYTKSGFIIQLETAVTVSSLQEVLEYFLEKTEYKLHPYTPGGIYETRIAVMHPECVTPSTQTNVHKEQVAPAMLMCSENKPGEGEYVVPIEHNLNKVQLDEDCGRTTRRARAPSIPSLALTCHLSCKVDTFGICDI
ncbi:signal-transducing adaptor protein 1-like isoform X1 [Syngnathus typhle]|uniref:signal-transducing adaptor protein 1-like isoform X1 n=2 Tax=Syngnathus typhle TaxID=161592 RepID=UPI002A6B6093|nr:signal-transducing adaptor protein 1-like isoform X1 [Syngnathus typhle]XP_061130246.1 signal-transducing adaptor protein 1-like isoform X1 [Syngnathus typhle]